MQMSLKWQRPKGNNGTIDDFSSTQNDWSCSIQHECRQAQYVQGRGLVLSSEAEDLGSEEKRKYEFGSYLCL